MANRDYYDILGVGKGVGEEDIRKAFRKKAMEFHPDRNKSPDAEEKFKEINEAYQVLSDSGKRSRYDQFGKAGVAGPVNPLMGSTFLVVLEISSTLSSEMGQAAASRPNAAATCNTGWFSASRNRCSARSVKLS